jgi:FtsP/CotA-like multicopper oxidase with cupredoxin domain
LQVCEGDIVVVDVKSHLRGLETALHWHGQLQRGSPYMDGVPMVTQCPIQSKAHFRYKFRASNPGTHFYHSHYGKYWLDWVFIIRVLAIMLLRKVIINMIRTKRRTLL